MLRYKRKVPHVAHDAKRLSSQLKEYIDKHKVTNHTYLNKLEDYVPSDLAKEFPLAVGYSKDLINSVLNMKIEAKQALRAAQSTGNLLTRRVSANVDMPKLTTKN